MTPQVIPLADCIRGRTYRLVSRNLVLGVYDGSKGFVGIRQKFDSLYLFTEYHYDIGPPSGTASPVEDVGECPITDLRENGDSFCATCGALTLYVDYTNGPRPSRLKGSTNLVRGRWRHITQPPKRCRRIRPSTATNKALFDWLDAKQDEVARTCKKCALPYQAGWPEYDDGFCPRRDCWDSRCQPCPTCGIKVLDSDGTQLCERCLDPEAYDKKMADARVRLEARWAEQKENS